MAVLSRLIGEAGAPGARTALPVSLQVSLMVERLRRERAFTPAVEAAADRLIGLALNLELAIDEGAPPERPKAAVLEALDQFDTRVRNSPPG